MNGIHTHRFNNGFRLALEERSTLGVSLELHLPFGSALDPEGKAGLSALVAEWIFRGAGPYSAQDLLNRLDDLSTGRGSGGVSSEHMPFKTSCLPEHLEAVLHLLGVVLREPQLQASELRSLKALALADLETMQDSPADQAQLLFREALLGKGYGHYASGTPESLKSIRHRDAVKHAGRLSLEGAVLTVVGPLDWERLLDTVNSIFGDWQAAAPEFPTAHLNPPFQMHQPSPTQQTHILLAHPAFRPSDPEWYAFMLAVNVLSGGSSSRLFDEVREKRGLVYGVHAGIQVIRDVAYLQTYASSSPGKARETLQVTLEVIAGLKNGISAAELQHARTGVLSDLIMSGENSRSRAAQMARDLWRLGHVRSLKEIQQCVEKVTLEQVQATLEGWTPELLGLFTLGQEALHVS
ncbi:M16 family metallopeptidase [Deinococcus cellulosilyticus]|uniref:Peptidase M16 n=1 Tax=Deinococcus cellulosilyticus (strain DSM 18568 / NBRC 106333 / KACC 11606 / 5516J-15) TaxID=1223518 RepID=A0A511MZP6_DEIC1|nr:pitrilysin family protein [Deinococcus cellulosilyticus]GEM45718.1 peptidase M16 [Deinococcus cellulosilyticus NBRC 106333 = KACC 11606]